MESAEGRDLALFFVDLSQSEKLSEIKPPLVIISFFTEPNQNWCTIRVDVPNHAVTCPESDLALKVKVLKKAADLAAKEKTTVRIPIATLGEVKNFGVYAVPGLETHVFVGPFTSKNEEISDNDDIVCLDDDNQNRDTAVNLPDTNRQPMVNLLFFLSLFFSFLLRKD